MLQLPEFLEGDSLSGVCLSCSMSGICDRCKKGSLAHNTHACRQNLHVICNNCSDGIQIVRPPPDSCSVINEVAKSCPVCDESKAVLPTITTPTRPVRLAASKQNLKK